MSVADAMPARAVLPEASGPVFLTDGGLETTMVFHEGIDLPCFSAITLMAREEGREALRRYFRRYLDIARASGAGFVLDTATWRASRDWAGPIGADRETLARWNAEAVRLAAELRREAALPRPVVLSGVIGPRGDGYVADRRMEAGEAADYHAFQAEIFGREGVDAISAVTMTHPGEAAGIALAAQKAGLPAVVSFTVETDGRLPSGETLAEAIDIVEHDTHGHPAYYMVNCAHPDHFREVFAGGGAWTRRIRGIRANASRMSHAELDAATELDDGDPEELGRDYGVLSELLPNLRVLGGCCGTDHRHVAAMARAVAG